MDNMESIINKHNKKVTKPTMTPVQLTKYNAIAVSSSSSSSRLYLKKKIKFKKTQGNPIR